MGERRYHASKLAGKKTIPCIEEAYAEKRNKREERLKERITVLEPQIQELDN